MLMVSCSGSISPPLTPRIAAEGANALLNICYEPENVTYLLNTPGVQRLIDFLSDSDPELQANAAGAIQSICFQPKGRKHVRELEGLQVRGHHEDTRRSANPNSKSQTFSFKPDIVPSHGAEPSAASWLWGPEGRSPGGGCSTQPLLRCGFHTAHPEVQRDPPTHQPAIGRQCGRGRVGSRGAAEHLEGARQPPSHQVMFVWGGRYGVTVSPASVAGNLLGLKMS